MELAINKQIATVKPGKVTAYRKNPANLDLAVYAAAYYAKKNNERMIVARGNSYMNAVNHIVKENRDIFTVNAMPGEQQVLVVEIDGKVFQATAK